MERTKKCGRASWLLGLVGWYYRKFIHNYRKIVEPLTNLLKKNSFVWSPRAAKAFHTLKLAVSSAPVKILPDFPVPVEIETEASGKGMEAVLMQRKRTIAYFSKALHGRHLLLPTYEKEMLALIP